MSPAPPPDRQCSRLLPPCLARRASWLPKTKQTQERVFAWGRPRPEWTGEKMPTEYSLPLSCPLITDILGKSHALSCGTLHFLVHKVKQWCFSTYSTEQFAIKDKKKVIFKERFTKSPRCTSLVTRPKERRSHSPICDIHIKGFVVSSSQACKAGGRAEKCSFS